MSDASTNIPPKAQAPNHRHGQESSQLKELQSLLIDSKGISRVLPEAIQLSSNDEKLATAALPTIEQAIKASVAKDQTILSDALFPIMGPAIRKAVSAALQNLIQTLNQSLEHSLSPQSFLWRLEARRTGKSFAEIVFLRTLLYQVEQVLLIHKTTGLLLQQIVAETVTAQDPDLVSAMLTAIQDFVKDSFNVPGDSLNTLQLDEFTIWIEESPYAILACVIRGYAPQELRVTMKKTLEKIHRAQQDQLKTFQGDNAPFDICKPDLELCLQSQQKTPSKGKPSPLLLVFLGTILLGIGIWGFMTWQAGQRWSTAVRSLNNEAGIVVAQAKKKGGTYSIVGLRDPLTKELSNKILKDAQIDPDKVDARWEPYLSFHPKLVKERARIFLQPPNTVSLDMKNDNKQVLSATGVAPQAWIDEAEKLAQRIPGVVQFNTEALLPTELSELDRLQKQVEQRVLLFNPGSTQLNSDQTALLQDQIRDIQQLLLTAKKANKDISVVIQGHTDQTGTELNNILLSQARAIAIRSIFRASGIDDRRLKTMALGDKKPMKNGDGSSNQKWNRRVSFQVNL